MKSLTQTEKCLGQIFLSLNRLKYEKITDPEVLERSLIRILIK